MCFNLEFRNHLLMFHHVEGAMRLDDAFSLLCTELLRLSKLIDIADFAVTLGFCVVELSDFVE